LQLIGTENLEKAEVSINNKVNWAKVK